MLAGVSPRYQVETAMSAALCLDVLAADPDYLPSDREAKALALVRQVYRDRGVQGCLREFAYGLWRELRNA